MNEFYKIAAKGTEEDLEYQLNNLGDRRIWMSYGFVKRDGYGGTTSSSHSSTRPVTAEDYDQSFALKAVRMKPAYAVRELLNFHYDHYVERGFASERFLEHIQYVILPIIKKRKDSEVFVELIDKWITSKTMSDSKTLLGNTNISGSNNVVNIAGGSINQSGVSLGNSNIDYTKLRELGVDDLQLAELKEIIETKSDNKQSVSAKAFKWLGDVGKTIVAKGIGDNLPAIAEYVSSLAHNL